MRTPNLILLIATLLGTVSWTSDAPLLAQAAGDVDCNRPAAEPVVHVPLPGEPVAAVSSRDGCWLFVRTIGGLSVLRRKNGAIEPVRPPIPLADGSAIALTRDDAMLIARLPRQLIFFDTQKLIDGDADPQLGTLESPRFSSERFPVTLLVTRDDRFLIATHHYTDWMTAIDLDVVRARGPVPEAIVSGIPTAPFPNSMAPSSDGRWLYLYQARAPERLSAPPVCEPSFQRIRPDEIFRRGVVSVVDIHALLSGSSDPFVTDVLAGCEHGGMVLSASGDRLYELAHGDELLRVFDTTAVATGAPPQQVAAVRVGFGPRHLVLADNDRTLIVAHGFPRAPSDTPRFLTVIDATRVDSGAAAIRGVIPTRSNVTALALSPDQQTLFVMNRTAQSLQVVDLARMSLEPVPIPGERQQ
jgi:hypothetical protein